AHRSKNYAGTDMTIYFKFFLSILTLCLTNAALPGEIFEIKLVVHNVDCEFCNRSILEELRSIPGVANTGVFTPEGVEEITWKGATPFQSAQFFKTFAKTKFLLKQICIDVEGIIEIKKDVMTLRSRPDNSIFFIDNQNEKTVAELKDGQSIRLKGYVTSQQGFNFLIVQEVLPENTSATD
ncbi:MAG: hypothetical protein JWO53_1035, partial [Chlamydiia bacterium]|nr:hypothetical protein [Chlamydiia bacterium]